MRRRRGNLFQVVEHEEEWVASEESSQPVKKRPRHPLTHAKRSGNRGMNEVGIVDRGESDEGGPMSRGVGDFFSHPNCQSRLTDAAGPGQGEQWDIGPPQKRLKGGNLAFPPDEGRQKPR